MFWIGFGVGLLSGGFLTVLYLALFVNNKDDRDI